MVTDTNTSYDMGSSFVIATHRRVWIFTNIAETQKRNGEG
jgi:hypothetical protein